MVTVPPPELPPETHQRVRELHAAGDGQRDRGEFDAAFESYLQALRLLPTPFSQWDAALRIYAAIGDLFMAQGDFDRALSGFTSAMRDFPAAFADPRLHLRIGQCLLECGQHEAAADELTRAYSLAGPEVFKDDDPKYLRFLATRAKGISTWEGIALS